MFTGHLKYTQKTGAVNQAPFQPERKKKNTPAEQVICRYTCRLIKESVVHCRNNQYSSYYNQKILKDGSHSIWLLNQHVQMGSDFSKFSPLRKISQFEYLCFRVQ